MTEEPVNNVVVLAERARERERSPSAVERLIEAQQAYINGVIAHALATERMKFFDEIATLRREVEQLRSIVEAERGGQIVCIKR